MPNFPQSPYPFHCLLRSVSHASPCLVLLVPHPTVERSAGGKRPSYSQRTPEFHQWTSGPRQVSNGQYQISPGDRNLGRREIRPEQSKPVSAGLARQNRTGMRPNSTYSEQSPRYGWSHFRPANNYNNQYYNNKNLESQDATCKQ